MLGGTVWLGFIATTLAVSTYSQGRTLNLWLIDNDYRLLASAIMGGLLAVWD